MVHPAAGQALDQLQLLRRACYEIQERVDAMHGLFEMIKQTNKFHCLRNT
jgi:hypothetical protein